ncbi:hypothetical protein [Roseitranquillus sediminis]|uniref:hypothetical protein n=1 Tax=Roseitranquillus sediminis TaxID=2809051 RepID=UPI001D0CD510|nr:hypothetical protein [Roseitranquillus sediminis]MBM9595960.1 hypothetical protein [Roseitranquillus sediminis]
MSKTTRRARDDLAAFLTRLQRRLWLRAALDAGLWAIVAAAPAAFLSGDPLVSATAATAVAGGIMIHHIWTSRAISTARFADDALSTDALLSTAADVSGAWTQHRGPVARGLLQRAQAAAERTDAHRLVPLLGRGAKVAAALAAAAWLVVLTAPPRADRKVPVPALAEAGPSEPQATAAQASELAALIGADAEMQDNDLMDRVAAELQNVVRKAGRGEMTQSGMDAAVGGLLEQARTAYGDRPPAWLPSEGERSADIGERLASHRAAQAAAAEVQDGLQASPVGDPSPDMAAGGAGGDVQGTATAGADAARGALPGAAPEAGAAKGTFSSAGASTQSTRGAGDQAGLGSVALENQAAAGLPGWEAREAMEVAARAPSSGARIRLEVAAEPGAGAAGARGEEIRAGSGASGLTLRRERVGPSDRVAVARYFTPNTGPD